MRSFADANGDGNGDLRGLIERLDHLNDGDPATDDDLGVTGLWLMPVMESISYHGYDVTDYRAVEPDYGSIADMRDLVAAAHARGMAVIVDLPLNHTSIDHPWFVDSRTAGSDHDDWYVWSDSDPGYPGPDGRPAWHPADGRWYYGVFWSGMPDLNLENPDTTAELNDIARHWLTDIGVDGFRLDGAKHLIEEGMTQVHTDATLAWLAGFHDTVRAVDTDALLVGEVWDSTSIASRYVPDAADAVFEFGLAAATVQAARSGVARQLAAARLEVTTAYPPGGFASFLTNHDQERVATSLAGALEEVRLAARLLLTGPGTPFVYYGEEIGLTGAKPDERIRTPLPWNGRAPSAGFSDGEAWEALEPGWETRNVANLANDPDSLLSEYRDLIRVRGEHPALRRGTYAPLETGSDVVEAAIRVADGETLIVISNVSEASVTDYGLEIEEGPLCGTPAATLALGEGSVTAPDVTPAGGLAGYRPLAELPPRSVSVLVLDP